MHLHNAVVVNCNTYSSPYLSLFQTQLVLERIHRARVNLSLGILKQTLTTELLPGTKSLSVTTCARHRLLYQLLRFHRTAPGRLILNLMVSRLLSLAAPLVKLVRDQLAHLQELPASPWSHAPPWLNALISCRDNISGIKKKCCVPGCILRMTAESYLDAEYPGHICVFMDGSVSRGSRTTTAAYTMPSFDVEWSDHLTSFASSTIAEVAAITKALLGLVHFQPHPTLIF